jgi:hypothetical protein
LESVYSASVRPIPLNVMTLYADLAQRLALQDTRPGSISSKKVDGRKYLYAVEKDGRTRTQRFLGPATSSVAQAEAARIRRAAELAKELRNTVTLLKNAHVPGPSLALGRILEVVANAGLFQRGVTLVGTAAYQTYACVVGSHLAAANLTTNDVDLSLSEFVAGDREEGIQAILKRADATFEPVLHADDGLPKVFMAANGFTVDFVTRRRRGRRSPVPVASLGVSAVALNFQELPVEDTMEAVALYGSGVLVRVPSPLKFAVHKLIVAQQRRQAQTAKKQKDLSQAQELIDIYLETDEGALVDALDDARERGRAWKSAINASLREIGREAGQGRLPVATSSRKRT